jgi:small subunit ribosomal protein S1
VLDIDRDRQRISLGLKQTQEDPWQRVVDTYNVGDELEGTVTKVVTFGAFVEILDGVEGLVHISELANHHVENPREVVNQGDVIRVKILEIDSERRRLSLSAKRVEDQVLPVPGSTAGPIAGDEAPTDDEGALEGEVRDLGLSEDVFSDAPAPEAEAEAAPVEPAAAPDEPPVTTSDSPGAEFEMPEGAMQAAEAASEAPAEAEAAPEAPAEEPAAEAEAAPEAPAEEPAAEAVAAPEEPAAEGDAPAPDADAGDDQPAA